MAVPTAQLDTWSHQGAMATAQATHTSVRAALSHAQSLVRLIDYEIFLQGSYRNSTNIYAESDVDIVVQLKATYTADTSALNDPQRRLYGQAFSPATYPYANFRGDVLGSLQKYYGATAIKDGNKAIKVLAAPGRLNADVVPAVTHRVYLYYLSDQVSKFEEGIALWDKSGRRIVNFPKQHIQNGQDKNQRVQRYKETVRIFKNARTYLVTKNRIHADLVPSYFLECFLYNVPDLLFVLPDKQSTVRRIIEFLRDTNIAGFTCQNGLTPLFGPTPEQWNIVHAKTLVSALIDLWNGWPL
jgi:hypothetical protein